jgi:ABC-type uncharacterized transport system substrate-binding protein
LANPDASEEYGFLLMISIRKRGWAAVLISFLALAVVLLVVLFAFGHRGSLLSPTTILVVNPSMGHGTFIVHSMQARLETTELIPAWRSVRVIHTPVTRDRDELRLSLQQQLPQADAVVAITQFALELVLSLQEATGSDDPRPPVFFWSIDDIIAAEIVPNPERPTRGATGVVPGIGSTPAEQLRLSYLQQFVPSIQRITVFFNPNDEDFIQGLDAFEDTSHRLGLELEFVSITGQGEAKAAIAGIDAQTQALFLFGDRNIGAYQGEIYERAIALGIPVSGPNFSSVRTGALTSYSFTEESVGAILADMVIAYLRGFEIQNIPVHTPEFGLAVNLSIAERIGLEVDGYLLHQADAVYR